MPEQISKYPDITLKVLQSAGSVCGEGAPQRILKQCPRERFCSLPNGEVCVYGIQDIPKMTQISLSELQAVIDTNTPQNMKPSFSLSHAEWLFVFIIFVIGIVIGKLSQRAGPSIGRQVN